MVGRGRTDGPRRRRRDRMDGPRKREVGGRRRGICLAKISQWMGEERGGERDTKDDGTSLQTPFLPFRLRLSTY